MFGAFMGGAMQGASFMQNAQGAYAKQKLLDLEVKRKTDEEETRVSDKKANDEIEKQVRDEVKAQRDSERAQQGVTVQPPAAVAPAAAQAAQGVAAPPAAPPQAAPEMAHEMPQEGVQGASAPLPQGTPPIAPAQPTEPVSPAASSTPVADAPAAPPLATPGFNPAAQAAGGVIQPGQPGSPESPVALPRAEVKGIGGKTDPHYLYSRKLELAMESGNTRLASQYRDEWSKAAEGDLKIDKNRYEKELLPQLHKIAKLEAEGKLETLPIEQRNRLMKAQQESEEMMTRHFAYGMKMLSNPLTRDAGLRILSDSPLILGKHKVADVKVMDGNLIPIGEDGQPIMNKGKPITFPAAAADAIVAEHFPGPKRETKVIPQGSVLVQEGPKRGQWEEVATGKDKPGKPALTPQQERLNVGDAKKQVDELLGADFQTGRLMNDSDEARTIRAQAKIIAEKLVKDGVSPQEAGDRAVKQAKQELAKKKAAGGDAAADAGLVDWKKYAGSKK